MKEQKFNCCGKLRKRCFPNKSFATHLEICVCCQIWICWRIWMWFYFCQNIPRNL